MATALPEDLSDFFVNAPLYAQYNLPSNKEIDTLYEYLIDENKFDCYCTYCGKISTFKFERWDHTKFYQTPMRREQLEGYSGFDITALCSRDNQHHYLFYLKYENDAIFKIGQFPSVADISVADTKQYHSLLGKEKYRELTKAIGLVSHGVGIGSFVYLRRIFEYLLEEAHREGKENIPGWDEKEYGRSRVGEKIDMLSSLLPSFLVENKGIYSILSKGIHELAEEECLEMFPVMKLGIELILDEKLKELEVQRKTEQARKSIQSYLQKHN